VKDSYQKSRAPTSMIENSTLTICSDGLGGGLYWFGRLLQVPNASLAAMYSPGFEEIQN